MEATVLKGLKDDDGGNLFQYRWRFFKYKNYWIHCQVFKLLPKVAEVVLIIPHTNAELERLVSIVKYMYMFMYIYIYIYIYIFDIFGPFIYETRWDII